MEATGLHGGGWLRVLHEGVPDKGAAKIFCHEHADPKIDAEDVGVVPVQVGVEGVAEAVASPGVLAVMVFECVENAQAIGGQERQRAGRGVRDD